VLRTWICQAALGAAAFDLYLNAGVFRVSTGRVSTSGGVAIEGGICSLAGASSILHTTFAFGRVTASASATSLSSSSLTMTTMA